MSSWCICGGNGDRRRPHIDFVLAHAIPHPWFIFIFRLFAPCVRYLPVLLCVCVYVFAHLITASAGMMSVRCMVHVQWSKRGEARRDEDNDMDNFTRMCVRARALDRKLTFVVVASLCGWASVWRNVVNFATLFILIGRSIGHTRSVAVCCMFYTNLAVPLCHCAMARRDECRFHVVTSICTLLLLLFARIDWTVCCCGCDAQQHRTHSPRNEVCARHQRTSFVKNIFRPPELPVACCCCSHSANFLTKLFTLSVAFFVDLSHRR